MQSILREMEEFRSQLEKGAIRKAYRALISFMMGLRMDFRNSYSGMTVSDLYQGYMDMTYFALVPPTLKQRGLKIAVVFNYDAFRFEAWLAGSNRKVQREYWDLFRGTEWPEYRVIRPARSIDSIIACDLAQNVDFSDPSALTSRIEAATDAFIDDIETFLSEHKPVE